MMRMGGAHGWIAAALLSGVFGLLGHGSELNAAVDWTPTAKRWAAAALPAEASAVSSPAQAAEPAATSSPPVPVPVPVPASAAPAGGSPPSGPTSGAPAPAPVPVPTPATKGDPVVPPAAAVPAPAPVPNSSVEISYDYSGEDSAEASDDSFAEDFRNLFRNPAVITNLNSGAALINRSIESIMESVFYSLLDNEFRYDVSRTTFLALRLQRDVYSTPTGAYIVVDRFSPGPGFGNDIARLDKIPVRLNVDASVDILDIYIQTDAARVFHHAQLPLWRRVVNNWFGVLPVLQAILPPAFNVNELYDPLHQLEVPTLFPFSVKKFHTMPVGSIRSYGLSGGVRITFPLGEGLSEHFHKEVGRGQGFTLSAPYTLFRTGEHRINVLRRGDNLAWVGVTDLTRTGHSFGTFVGSSIVLLDDVVSYWKGMKTPLFPINAQAEQALANEFSRLYAFDLTKGEARDAYESAVLGDFTKAHSVYENDKKNANDNGGVTFYFRRDSDSLEVSYSFIRNLILEKFQRKAARRQAEIRIRDQKGQFFILEGSKDLENEDFNALVGNRNTKFRATAILSVERVKSKSGKWTYTLAAEPDAERLIFTMNIMDRATDSAHLVDYLAQTREFTTLELEDVPAFEMYDADATARRNRELALSHPRIRSTLPRQTPIVLGRFSSKADVAISIKGIRQLEALPDETLWRAFARAFGVDEADWKGAARNGAFTNAWAWMKSQILFPLRAVNMEYPRTEAYYMSRKAIGALGALRKLLAPVDRLDGYYNLFDTQYPIQLVHALTILSDPEQTPRTVLFTSKAQGNAPPEEEIKFKKLNGKTFASSANQVSPHRYEVAKEQLQAFYPKELSELRKRPQMTQVAVITKSITDQDLADAKSYMADVPLKDLDPSAKFVYVTVNVSHMEPGRPANFYLRVTQSGKVQLGKLALGEGVFQAPTIARESATLGAETQSYGFFVTGPLSPISTFLMTQATSLGGEFQVQITASQSGTAWGDERLFKFVLDEGRLRKP